MQNTILAKGLITINRENPTYFLKSKYKNYFIVISVNIPGKSNGLKLYFCHFLNL
jgi:hypothetical protein